MHRMTNKGFALLGKQQDLLTVTRLACLDIQRDPRHDNIDDYDIEDVGTFNEEMP